jgi:SAM-dependent methyltransferase
VLEAGCGRRSSRADSLALPELGIETVVGVDLDTEAGSRNPGLDAFVAADLCSPLPFEDGAFDLVYASFVVEHLNDPEAAFREWRRVLSDGAVLVVTPNIANPVMRLGAELPQRAREMLKRFGPGVEPRDVFPATYRANTAPALRRIVARAGFAVPELHHVATLHRYAGGHSVARALLLGIERLLPVYRRSTLVALLRPVRPTVPQAPGLRESGLRSTPGSSSHERRRSTRTGRP